MPITVKRAYQPPSTADGTRVLVDRHWPRGVRRDLAMLDAWMRDLAPSRELIAWFGHRAERWEEFRRRHWSALEGSDYQDNLRLLRERAARDRVTLVYGARDEQHNNAVALAEYLEKES